jgi:quercetin dioxygenase-like cupin family protein
VTGDASGSGGAAARGAGAAGSAAGVAARLRELGLDAGAWSNGPGDRYPAHEHGYDKVLACEWGSIRFGLPDRGETVDLAAGDRLDLPAGTRHDALVGPAGVTCLEARVPAGTLAGLRRQPAGSW